MTIAIILLGWLVAWGLFWRTDYCELPERRRFNVLAPGDQLVSVIIPARNEAHHLPRLLTSLTNGTHSPSEILVVSDQSTDATVSVAKAHGARVLELHGLPEDWLGKPHACYQGAKEASGDLLLFLDADTWLTTTGLERLLATFVKQKLDAMSVQPFHVVSRLYEGLSSLFNLVIPASVGACLPPFLRRFCRGGFGPCFLTNREAYFSLGGHQAVRHELLEHYMLSFIYQKNKKRLGHFLGKGALNFRMYPRGIMEVMNGWGKSFLTGARLTSVLPLIGVVLWMIGSFSVVSLMADTHTWTFPHVLLFSLIYLLYALQFHVLFKKVGNFKPWIALLFPVELFFYLVVLLRSLVFKLLGRPIRWKDRSVHSKKERTLP